MNNMDLNSNNNVKNYTWTNYINLVDIKPYKKWSKEDKKKIYEIVSKDKVGKGNEIIKFEDLERITLKVREALGNNTLRQNQVKGQIYICIRQLVSAGIRKPRNSFKKINKSNNLNKSTNLNSSHTEGINSKHRNINLEEQNERDFKKLFNKIYKDPNHESKNLDNIL